MPFPNSESARWYEAELRPHEPILRAWLQSQFSDVRDIDDIVQEAVVRTLRARDTVGLRSPKAFFFVTARNLALMQLRHRKVAGESAFAEIDVSGIMDEQADIRGQ